jgi:toxin ParE1/3/4
MPLKLSQEADEDLRRIYLYGAEVHGLDAADRYAARLRKALDLIADNPRMARRREELDGDVRAHPVRAHIIVYEIGSDDEVIVLRVRHGREDWQRSV